MRKCLLYPMLILSSSALPIELSWAVQQDDKRLCSIPKSLAEISSSPLTAKLSRPAPMHLPSKALPRTVSARDLRGFTSATPIRNCQFSSIGEQLGRLKILSTRSGRLFSNRSYLEIKKIATDHIEQHRDLYIEFVDSLEEGSGNKFRAFSSYIARLSNPGASGDDITLKAISRHFNVHVAVITTEGIIYVNRRKGVPFCNLIVLRHTPDTHYISVLPENSAEDSRDYSKAQRSIDLAEVDPWSLSH